MGRHNGGRPSLSMNEVLVAQVGEAQPKAPSQDLQRVRAYPHNQFLAPMPHQFLLNDTESIFPVPLETGAGCAQRADPVAGESGQAGECDAAVNLGPFEKITLT